jgi:RNA polymerase sigma factor (sigma-70 family)
MHSTPRNPAPPRDPSATHRYSIPIVRELTPRAPMTEVASPAPARLRGDDIAALLQSARAGDERAWSLLVSRYGASIHAIARRHRLSPADQEEVAQRTWLRLVEHIDSVRSPAAIGGWLRTVARHECLRVLATCQREVPTMEPLPADAPDANSVEDTLNDAMREQALHHALEALPEQQRRVLRSLLVEPHLNYEQLSAQLGIARGSIGPTRQRGLERLRRDPRLRRALDGHHDHRTPGRPVRLDDLT